MFSRIVFHLEHGGRQIRVLFNVNWWWLVYNDPKTKSVRLWLETTGTIAII